MGNTGTAAGLLDANTNMTYAVKYLAGAYRVANGNADRAVCYYAAGYYYAAKSRGVALPSRVILVTSGGSTTSDSNIKFASKKKFGRAYAQSERMTSSSSLYGGRPDYH
jgi:hypothetical protein